MLAVVAAVTVTRVLAAVGQVVLVVEEPGMGTALQRLLQPELQTLAVVAGVLAQAAMERLAALGL